MTSIVPSKVKPQISDDADIDLRIMSNPPEEEHIR